MPAPLAGIVSWDRGLAIFNGVNSRPSVYRRLAMGRVGSMAAGRRPSCSIAGRGQPPLLSILSIIAVLMHASANSVLSAVVGAGSFPLDVSSVHHEVGHPTSLRRRAWCSFLQEGFFLCVVIVHEVWQERVQILIGEWHVGL